MYPQAGTGVVYASPAPGMPNGGVIFSLGGDAAGRGGQFIIPLPLGGLQAPPTQAAAADLSKHKKWQTPNLAAVLVSVLALSYHSIFGS